MINKRSAYFPSSFTAGTQTDGKRYIEGYFAVFNQETELWPGWYEQLAQGAFDSSLLDNDIRCLFNHNTGSVMGRTSSGTLALRTDAHGLWGRVEINEEDREAMDVYARVSRGDISGCSFGFDPLEEKMEQREDGIHNTVLVADTVEVSICTFPAYPQTEIQARQQIARTTRKQMLATRAAALKTRLEAYETC